jgi:hypothetical protein
MIVYQSLTWAAVPDEMDGSNWSMNKWCCVIDKQRLYPDNRLIGYRQVALKALGGA